VAAAPVGDVLLAADGVSGQAYLDEQMRDVHRTTLDPRIVEQVLGGSGQRCPIVVVKTLSVKTRKIASHAAPMSMDRAVCNETAAHVETANTARA
jgi:hypothetical protein